MPKIKTEMGYTAEYDRLFCTRKNVPVTDSNPPAKCDQMLRVSSVFEYVASSVLTGLSRFSVNPVDHTAF
jgi:hypothetical protein